MNIKTFIAVFLCCFISIAQAQFGGGSNSGGITQSQLDAALSDIMAVMPQAGSIVPPTDNPTGAIGNTTTKFMREDAVRPARYRSTTCILSGGAGTCSLVWSTSFTSTPLPLGDPTIVNSNPLTSMLQCNWTSVTVSGATVKCTQPLPSLIGGLLNASNGLIVAGTAVQPL